MEAILAIIFGVIFGAINVTSFYLGYRFRDSIKDPDAVVVDENNREAVADLMKFLNYK